MYQSMLITSAQLILIITVVHCTSVTLTIWNIVLYSYIILYTIPLQSSCFHFCSFRRTIRWTAGLYRRVYRANFRRQRSKGARAHATSLSVSSVSPSFPFFYVVYCRHKKSERSRAQFRHGLARPSRAASEAKRELNPCSNATERQGNVFSGRWS